MTLSLPFVMFQSQLSEEHIIKEVGLQLKEQVEKEDVENLFTNT